MPHRREPRPAMPRGRGYRPAMPRGREPPRPGVPLGKRARRLAEEVLYLHSLWRRGPPPAPAPAPAPNQSGSADPKTKTKTTGPKRRKLDGGGVPAAAAAAEPKGTGVDWAPAPPPSNPSPKTWPEAAAPSSSTPAKLPPRPTSPGALAHKKALRAAAEFFSNRGASSDGDGEGSESEGEQGAAGFITGLFERDAALRGHYERGREDAQFACMACAGGTRNARRFRGCTALVQHAHGATTRTRYGRQRAHRALAAVICRVLGWDVARLPSIVIDPRGTLGQALAAGATTGVQQENGDTGEDNDSSSDEDEEEDVETWMEDSSTDDDEEEDELESSEESAETEDDETGMEDSSTDGDAAENELESSEESAEKEDFKKGTEDSKNTDKDEAIDPDNSEKSAEKEEIEQIGPTNCQEISKNEVFCNEPVEKVNASKGHKQEVAKESSEQEKKVCENTENGESTS